LSWTIVGLSEKGKVSPMTTTQKTTRGKIRVFLDRFFQAEIKDDQDFFALGLVNSLFAMQLVLFVEKEFSIAVNDDDLDIDNFRTINAIARLIENKLGIQEPGL